MLTAEMGCTMGCMISGPIATMTADGADGDAESDITVPIVASVTCSWLPPAALPSIDMREPRARGQVLHEAAHGRCSRHEEDFAFSWD